MKTIALLALLTAALAVRVVSRGSELHGMKPIRAVTASATMRISSTAGRTSRRQECGSCHTARTGQK